MNEDYYSQVKRLAEAANEANPEIDIFAKRERGRVPTQAFSDFLTNKEQGDWAEQLMLKILNANLKENESISYGHSDTLIAGDQRFKEFYEKYQDELDKIGKCPDILIFKRRNLSSDKKAKFEQDLPREKLIDIVKLAECGLEVRSSAFLVSKYIEYMKNKNDKNDKERTFLSFTPKVEDIAVILKWIEVHNVPHYYVQVFFDSIYVLPFISILELLAKKETTKYTIEKNAKNQFKSTIHININEGIRLTDDVKLPKHNSKMKELDRGRLLFYVTFATSELPKNIDEDKLRKAFNL